MSKDLDNIARISEKIGRKLKRYYGSSFFGHHASGTYLLDEHKNVVGLNLCKCHLPVISFLELLPNLTQLDLSGNQIKGISVLKYLPKLTQLGLRGKIITDISIFLEIVKQGHVAIEAYFKSSAKRGKQTIFEVKTLQIDDRDSDKTSEIIEQLDEIKDDSVVRRISDGELVKRIKQPDKIVRTPQVETTAYVRNEYVSEFAKRKAKGICQLCESIAPFKDSNGKPYLETHHVIWLSRGGDDSVENVTALCPNCHRKMHELYIESDVEKLKRKAMENSKV